MSLLFRQGVLESEVLRGFLFKELGKLSRYNKDIR